MASSPIGGDSFIDESFRGVDGVSERFIHSLFLKKNVHKRCERVD